MYIWVLTMSRNTGSAILRKKLATTSLRYPLGLMVRLIISYSLVLNRARDTWDMLTVHISRENRA